MAISKSIFIGSWITLMLIGYRAEELQTFTSCMTNKKYDLGNNRARINYTGSEQTTCAWTIPVLVKREKHVVILWIENVTLHKTTIDNCIALLSFPGESGYNCKQKDNDCRIYTTRNNGCNMDEIKSVFPTAKFNCTHAISWDNETIASKIRYASSQPWNISNHFVIHYNTLSYHATTTSGTNTQPSTRQIPETGKQFITTTQGSENITIIIAVTVPAAVLLLLVIGCLLYRRHSRQKPLAADKDGPQNIEVAAKEMKVKEIFGTNDEQEEVANELYQTSAMANNSTEESSMYAVVKKEHKKGKKTITGQSDNAGTADLYSVVKKPKN